MYLNIIFWKLWKKQFSSFVSSSLARKMVLKSLMRGGRLLLKASSLLTPRCSFQSAVVSCYEKGVGLQEVKDRTPREGEMIVQVETAGVNYSDLLMIKGKYHHRPQLPFTPGFELVGTIQSVGKNISKWKEGDRILCMKSGETGAFSKFCTIHEKQDLILSLPYSISSDLAATIGVAYGSAYLGMKRLAMERKGNSFLILSSHGTTGLATMDLAQNVFEGVVFGASDSEEKLQYLRDANVLSTLNWTDGKLTKNIHKKTFGKGVDFVIDTVGGEVLKQGVECLKDGGHILSLAASSGVYPQVSLLDLHCRNASLSGIWLGGRPQEKIKENLEMLLRMFEEGFLKGLIKINKYPLEEVKRCVDEMQKPDFFGKAVLTMY